MNTFNGITSTDDIEQNLLPKSARHVENAEFTSVTHSYGLMAAAALLVASGSASEGAQAMFALCTNFGYDNFIATLMANNDAQQCFYLSLVITGAAFTAIQSACLEYSYTLDFLKNPLHFALTSAEIYFQLTLLEKIALAVTVLFGASVRGIISIMGYYAINGNLSATAVAIIYLSSAIDILLTMGTDGTYLKNNYLWSRSNKNDPQSQHALTTLFQVIHEETNPALTTLGSQGVYYTAIGFGSVAVLGEVGLAALALEQFARQYSDQTTDSELGLIIASLICFFLLLTASDTMTLAKKSALYYETHQTQATSQTVLPTTSPCTGVMTGIAAIISVGGALVRFTAAYSGTQNLGELLGIDKTNAGVIVASVIVGAIRAGQCGALEGASTMQASQSWCAWFKAPNSVEYTDLPTDDRQNSTIAHSTNPTINSF